MIILIVIFVFIVAIILRGIRLRFLGYKVETKIRIEQIPVRWLCLYKIVQRISKRDYYVDVRCEIVERRVKPTREEMVTIIEHNLVEDEEFYDILFIMRLK